MVIALKIPKSSHSEIAPIEKCDLVHTISYERVPIVSEFFTVLLGGVIEIIVSN